MAAVGARAQRVCIPIQGVDQIDVSIVLPCLNEEATVAECVEKGLQWFATAGVRGEVIVVDNGSTDRSRDEATRAGARVIEEERRGYGAAHLRGFAESQRRHHRHGGC